jgi:hypothetical protein
VSLIAQMLCTWCGFSRRCRMMPDVGWVCDHCWEAAEGIEVREAA